MKKMVKLIGLDENCKWEKIVVVVNASLGSIKVNTEKCESNCTLTLYGVSNMKQQGRVYNKLLLCMIIFWDRQTDRRSEV